MRNAAIEKQWYIAELILEINVEGDTRNVVHKNLILIEASSADDAYSKAIAMGKQNEMAYENPHGKNVRISYRGINKLNLIDDPLEDGAELMYEEDIGMSSAQIDDLIRPKNMLAVFRGDMPTQGPDYRSKDIVNEAEELLRRQRV